MLLRLRNLLRLGTVWIALLLASCEQGPDSGQEEDAIDDAVEESMGERQFTQKTVADEGSVCLSAGEDGGVVVDVMFSACLSSSCDRPDAATCSADVRNDRLVVSSALTFTSETTPTRPCDTDCTPIKVACGVIQPVGASLRVAHGAAESEAVALPLSGSLQFSGRDSRVSPGGSCEAPIDIYFR